MWWFLQQPAKSGLFNLGTGQARHWKDLVTAVFQAMELPPRITFIEMPEQLKPKYQYFTEAKMNKLRDAGYTAPFTSLEDGVRDYVTQYLRGEYPIL
jgi:ADP-L-glycero-D-manno-heptose 6-epimerase